MIDVREIAEVRAAEERAFALLADGVLMQRASHGLSVTILRLLRSTRGAVVGARVVLLVGSGNNGGDALWAGAMLARRGCRVDALCLPEHPHPHGEAALRAAGGRSVHWRPGDRESTGVLSAADVVVDGILGIGGAGALRPEAAALVEEAMASDAIVVAVDVPSGVDSDSGAVAGPAVAADVTVTFGALKTGLLVSPGALRSGSVILVDIGLEFDSPARTRVLEPIDVAAWVAEPAQDAYKYRRGVVGVSAGSTAYPGAALLTMSAARRANVGMARYLDRSDGVASRVVGQYPDVVVDGMDPGDQSRVDAWACGPGFPGDRLDAVTVGAVLAVPVPVVLDAGALSVLARDGDARSTVRDRHARGHVTVITPHEGEFERIFPGLLAGRGGRLAATRQAASDSGAVVLLKGPGTIIAAPDGTAFIDVEGTADLGTAGSGDVLTGIIGALLAGAWSAGRRDAPSLLEASAAAVWLHGAAGRIAAGRAPVVATDIAAALPAAIRLARFGDAAENGDAS